MARRLRHIDDVDKIKDWIEAMTAINRLLKDTDIKEYRDDWMPWRHRKKRGMVLKMDINEEEPAKVVKKPKEQLLPPLRVPNKTIPTTSHELRRSCRSTRGKTGIKDDGGKITGDDDRVKKKLRLDPKAEVLEMLNESLDQQEPNTLQGKLCSTEKKKIREKWRNCMLERVKKKKVPIEHWGDSNSGNFVCMLIECAPDAALIDEEEYQESREYLYKELMDFYDKG